MIPMTSRPSRLGRCPICNTRDNAALHHQLQNDPKKATAPAQEVTITQKLDADLDWNSFELGAFGFGP